MTLIDADKKEITCAEGVRLSMCNQCNQRRKIKEVIFMAQLTMTLYTAEIKARIEEKKHVIMPRTRWSGLKKEMPACADTQTGMCLRHTR